MLIEFSVRNHRSIRDRQTLSLVASASKELRDSNVMAVNAPSTPDLLRSLVIYGANASGKSNLLAALSFVRELVVGSVTRNKPDAPIPHQPFALGMVASKLQSSEFELIFVQRGVRYQYGLVVNTNEVTDEWLYAFPEGRQQMWFNRSRDGESGSTNWEFGPNLRGQKRVWLEATRTNALYLSTAVQLNSEQLKPVFEWFSVTLRGIAPFARVGDGFTTSQCDKNANMKSKVLEFLTTSDLGIADLHVNRRKFEIEALDDSLPEHVRIFLAGELGDNAREITEISLTHLTNSGETLTLPMDEESEGTKKIFALAGPWIDVLAHGYVLVVDELDTSLHPELLRHLIRLFHSPKTNPNSAQLIFSTHDTTLLDSDLFRRDQIWFVEKAPDLASHVYPLTDFSPRKGENLEKGYLQGRYGAIPFFGNVGA